MADELEVSNHLTARAGVHRYVRRVPEDVRAAFSFSRSRIALHRDQRQVRATALNFDRQWDEQFNEACQRCGIVVDGGFRPSVVSTTDWIWLDWEALADWFYASLAKEDCRERRGSVRDCALGAKPDLAHLPWRPDLFVKEHIARQQ